MKNLTLNIIKAIASFLVVFIHCRFSGEFGKIMVDLGRIAVPIFLLVSGFFSYNNDEKKLKKKIKHIFLLMLIANIVFFIWKILLLSDFNSIKSFLKQLILPKTILKFLIFNDNPFRTHLWYFNAILYCYIIMYLYEKIIKTRLKKELSKILIIGSVALLVIYITFYILYFKNNLEKLFILRNFIFVGMPFFYIGNYINKHQIKDKVSNKSIYEIMIISFVLLIIEIKFYTSEIYISTIICAIIIFVFAIKNPNILTNPQIENVGDKYSSYIYMYHPLIKDVTIKAYNLINISSEFLIFIQPIIILFISIIVSILISKITNFKLHKNKIIIT